MKNAKRILALVAAILLFGMYLSTLIFALIGSPHSIDLLYGYMLVFKLTRHNTPSDDSADSFHSHSSDDVSKLSQSHDQASDDTI